MKRTANGQEKAHKQTLRERYGSKLPDLFGSTRPARASDAANTEPGRSSPSYPNDGEVWLLQTSDGPRQAVYDALLDLWRDVNLTHVSVQGSHVRRVETRWFDFVSKPPEGYPALLYRPLRNGPPPPMWPWGVTDSPTAFVFRVDLRTRRLGFILPGVVDDGKIESRTSIPAFLEKIQERWRSTALRYAIRHEHVPAYLLGARHPLFDSWACQYFGPEVGDAEPTHWSRDGVDYDPFDK